MEAAPQEREPRHSVTPEVPDARGGRGHGCKRKRKRKRALIADEFEFTSDEYSDKWSGVSRAERYRARSGGAVVGSDGEEEEPVLPGVIDPITLLQVESPCISAYGHVTGRATWAAVLGERGKCPFTKQPLNPGQLTLLTHSNIDRFRDRIREDARMATTAMDA